jgi:hypothetical protein
MLSEANILEIRLQMEALICEREGMIAENAQRQMGDYTIAYGPGVFFDLAKQLEELRKTLVMLLESD